MEADADWVKLDVLSHQAHPAPKQRVGDQYAPDLMHDQLRLLAAQDPLTLQQVLLDIPEAEMDLQALAVELRQGCRGEPV